MTDADGAQLLVWWAVWSLAEGKEDAAALVSMAYWWAARTAGEAVAQSLHTFGGYGLSLEYDIQLYHRRAKALALTYGNPDLELDEAGRRLWLGAAVALPATGDVGIDFGSHRRRDTGVFRILSDAGIAGGRASFLGRSRLGPAPGAG